MWNLSYPYGVENEPESKITLRELGDAFVTSVQELFLKNSDRYTEQAKIFLAENDLVVEFDSEILLHYYFDRDRVGVGFRVSNDHGQTFSQQLRWDSLDSNYAGNVETVKWHFAGAEASLAL